MIMPPSSLSQIQHQHLSKQTKATRQANYLEWIGRIMDVLDRIEARLEKIDEQKTINLDGRTLAKTMSHDLKIRTSESGNGESYGKAVAAIKASNREDKGFYWSNLAIADEIKKLVDAFVSASHLIDPDRKPRLASDPDSTTVRFEIEWSVSGDKGDYLPRIKVVGKAESTLPIVQYIAHNFSPMSDAGSASQTSISSIGGSGDGVPESPVTAAPTNVGGVEARPASASTADGSPVPDSATPPRHSWERDGGIPQTSIEGLLAAPAPLTAGRPPAPAGSSDVLPAGRGDIPTLMGTPGAYPSKVYLRGFFDGIYDRPYIRDESESDDYVAGFADGHMLGRVWGL